MSHDFPHWKQKESFLLEMNQEIERSVFQRIMKRNNLLKDELQNEINAIVDNSSQQISKLTQEIRNAMKKGFG